MSTPIFPPEPWYEAAIEIMLHEHIPLLMAATRLGVAVPPMSPEEASAHERRKSFREMYRVATNRLYADAAVAVKDKDLVLGRVARNAAALEGTGKFKEANDSLVAAGKLQGWGGPDTVVNNFVETPAEMEEARRRLREKFDADELARRQTIQ